MTGRISKIKEYGLEGEVLDLLKQGLGPKRIANLLNKRHPEIPSRFNHVNIVVFRDGLPPEVLNFVHSKGDIKSLVPIEHLKSELETINQSVIPKLLEAIERKDSRLVSALNKTMMDTWDRLAQIENVLNPKEKQTEKIYIEKQFTLIKDRLADVFTQLCPDCQQKVMGLTKELTNPIIIDVQASDT